MQRNVQLPRQRVGQAPQVDPVQLNTIISSLRQQIETLQGENSVDLKKQLNTSLDNILLQKQRSDKLYQDLTQNRENIKQSQAKIEQLEKQRNAALSVQAEIKKSIPDIVQQLAMK